MHLVFFMDQIEQHCCALFQQAQEKLKYKRYFWEWTRSYFMHFDIRDWQTLYQMIIYGHVRPVGVPVLDTS